MTGHKDLKLADHYSKIEKETSLKIVEHIKSLGLHDANHVEAENVLRFKKAK